MHDRGFLCEEAQRIRDLSVEIWGEDRAVDLVGQAPNFRELLTKIVKAARYREPVLITGESGVGKEFLAQSIYLTSDLRNGPYVSMNCPQYREGNLTTSELFGHKKGSFTGAIVDRKGAFEEAHNGVLFLDEIADLYIDAQAMLLRALASGEFKPLGSERPRLASVRVVAATNRPLKDLVVAQQFRNDLLFRLRYFLLQVPPLRERGDDWRLLLEFTLARLQRKYGVEKRFSIGSMKILEGQQWPGNVRQLISVATMGYAMADGDVIEPADFASQIEESGDAVSAVDNLYHRLIQEKLDFWDVVYKPFMDRELNRQQVKSIISRGLISSNGSYRDMLTLLNMPTSDYQRVMDFLRHHQLKP